MKVISKIFLLVTCRSLGFFSSYSFSSFHANHFFCFMPDQSESLTPKAAVSSNASKSQKRGTGKNLPGVKFGNLKFKLPYDMERALRFASFQLEVNPKATHIEPEDLVIEAVRRHLDLLAKHMVFTPGMWPVSKTDPESTT